jgi:hypothetical protein
VWFTPTVGWAIRPCKAKASVTRSPILKGKPDAASELLPRVHLVISLLKRWLMGTQKGAVSHKHLDYYLDEFTFRFNWRKSRSRGKLFYRLAQQTVAVPPVPCYSIAHPGATQARKPQSLGVWRVKQIADLNVLPDPCAFGKASNIPAQPDDKRARGWARVLQA